MILSRWRTAKLVDSQSNCVFDLGFDKNYKVAYNAPQYGLPTMWGHHNFEVEYFEKIIHKALEHPRSSGSTVAVIGHSKGSEMATVISQTLHDLVDLTFTSGGPYFAFFHEFSNGCFEINSCSAAPSVDPK